MVLSDQNVPQHQKATGEVVKMFIEPIVLIQNPRPILFDDKYAMVEECLNLVIDAQDRQRALGGAPVGTPSVCQLPSGPSHKIDPQA
jgi:hypothetical protein